MLFIIIFLLFEVQFQQISCGSELSGLKQSEAERAYGTLVDIALEYSESYSSNLKALSASVIDKLLETDNNTLKNVNSKLDGIKSRVANLAETLQTVKQCNLFINRYNSEIEQWREKLTARILKCTEKTRSRLENLLDQVVQEQLLLSTGYTTCYKTSLDHCAKFAKNDSCFDSFIRNVKSATENLILDTKFAETNAINRFLAFKLPCHDLIESETLALPEYDLEALPSCSETYHRLGRDQACPTFTSLIENL